MNNNPTWKPKKWIAVLLAIFLQPFAMLYLQRVKLAVLYFILILVVVVAETYGRIVKGFTLLTYLSFYYPIAIVCTVHSYRLAKSYVIRERRPWYSRWYGMISILFLFYLGLAGLRVFFVEPFQIPSQAMYPTLPRGSSIFILKWGYGNYRIFGFPILKTKITKEIHRGDVIVFDYPENQKVSFIQRVIGVPGDKVQYKNNQLFLNGIAAEYTLNSQEQNFMIYSETIYGQSNQIALTQDQLHYDFDAEVPPEHYFIMGDNRNNSKDSRIWGFLSEEMIEGKLVYSIKGPVHLN